MRLGARPGGPWTRRAGRARDAAAPQWRNRNTGVKAGEAAAQGWDRQVGFPVWQRRRLRLKVRGQKSCRAKFRRPRKDGGTLASGNTPTLRSRAKERAVQECLSPLFSDSHALRTHTQCEPSLPRPEPLQPHPVGQPPWTYQMAPGGLCVAREAHMEASSWAAQKVLRTGRRWQVGNPMPSRSTSFSPILFTATSPVLPRGRPGARGAANLI